MKKFGLFLMVVAVVALSVATSQAALVSLYTFDNTANNTVVGAPNGTLVGSASYVAGAVGAAGVSTGGGTNYVDATSDMLPNATSGVIYNGSASYWINTTVGTDNVLIRGSNSVTGGGDSTWLLAVDFSANQPYVGIRSDDGSWMLQATAAGVAGLNNGSWHQITETWHQTTDGIEPNTATIYVDGAAKATTWWLNTITSGETFYDWQAGTIGTGNTGNTPIVGTEAWASGSMDDVAIWDNLVTATQAKALYNLGVDSLDYNAADAAKLFDLYAAGSGTAEVGGQTWEYAASGLGTVAGAVISSSALNLGGADGSGCQIIPEPGTLTLLGAALVGLLVFAWRKRK